jgi:cytosine/adenosine deaminase-related metal-dependent hydrolase
LVIWERWLVAPAPRRRLVGLAALLVITVGVMANDPDPFRWVEMFFVIAAITAWSLPAREAVRAITLILATFLGSAVAFSFGFRLTALFFLFLALISVSMMNRRCWN